MNQETVTSPFFVGAGMKQTVKVAAVQAAPVCFDLTKSLEKLDRLVKEASDQRADLVVFPYVESTSMNASY